MRRILLVLFFITLTVKSFSQWSFKTVKSDFDGTYKRAIVVGSGGEFPYKNPYLVVRYGKENDLEIYISDAGYSGCDNRQVFFKFNGDDEKYKSLYINEGANSDSWFIQSLENITFFELLDKFMNHSSVSVRLRNDCGIKDYRFSLSGSSRAIRYVIPSKILTDELEKIRLKRKKKIEKIEFEKKSKAIRVLEVKRLFDSIKQLELDKNSMESLKLIIDKDINTFKFKINTIKLKPNQQTIKDRFVDAFYILENDNELPIFGLFRVEDGSSLIEKAKEQEEKKKALELLKKEKETLKRRKEYEDAKKRIILEEKERNRIKEIVSKYNYKPIESFILNKAYYYTNDDTSTIKDITIIITDLKKGNYQYLDLILTFYNSEELIKLEFINPYKITKKVLKAMGGKKSIEF